MAASKNNVSNHSGTETVGEGGITLSNDETIGGIAVGAAGAVGTIYEGYKLAWGDDFIGQLDILAPHRPRGRWWTTRTYLAGSRGSDTLLGTMYDTDPFHTGHGDSNRGVPVGFDNMRQSASVIALQARRATTDERKHFSPTRVSGGRSQLGAMISGAGAVHWYPSDQDTGDIIYECRIKFSAKAGNPAGWHPTQWVQSLNPVIAINSDEIDWEGNSQNIGLGFNRWNNGSGAGTAVGPRVDHDGKWHVVSMVLSLGLIQLYRDGVLFATGAYSANTKGKPQYPLLTSHVYAGSFEGDTYSQAPWDADADGATMEVDYLRVWSRIGKPHLKPLVAGQDVNIDFGATTKITLPSKAKLWGDASASEYLQVIYNEEAEPGVEHAAVFTRFPLGVSYEEASRELTIMITSGKTGRLNFVLSAWREGGTGEPYRFAVNIGPRLNVATAEYTVGKLFSFDLYMASDCGVLVTDGTQRLKMISVTGLPAWASFSDTTGLITGTPTDTGTSTLRVTIVNSVGQSAIGIITLFKEEMIGYGNEAWIGLN